MDYDYLTISWARQDLQTLIFEDILSQMAYEDWTSVSSVTHQLDLLLST